MNACQICVLVMSIVGFAAGFACCLLSGWFREASASQKYWTEMLKDLKKGQE